MSIPRVHVIQSLTASVALYPAIGVNVIPFSLATVLIDIDHVIEYFVRRRNSEYATSIRGILKNEKIDLAGIDNLKKWLIE